MITKNIVTGTDVFLSNLTPDTHRGQTTPHNKWCYVEFENGIEIRSLLNWNIPHIPNMYVKEAYALFYTDTQTSYGTTYGIWAMNKKWDTMATWNTCNRINSWENPGGDYDSPLLAKFTIPIQSWFKVKFNPEGVNWLQTVIEKGHSNGLIIKCLSGTGKYDRFVSFRQDNNYTPQLSLSISKTIPKKINTVQHMHEIGKQAASIPHNNKPAPNWVTWIEPRINNKIVFMYGSDHALFFAERAKKLICIEHLAKAHNKNSEELNIANYGAETILRHVEAEEDTTPYPYSCESYGTTNRPYLYFHFKKYVNTIREYNKMEIIVINGRARSSCIKEAVKRIKKGGFIILKDSLKPEYKNAIDLHLKKYPRKNFKGIDEQTSIFLFEVIN